MLKNKNIWIVLVGIVIEFVIVVFAVINKLAFDNAVQLDGNLYFIIILAMSMFDVYAFKVIDKYFN